MKYILVKQKKKIAIMKNSVWMKNKKKKKKMNFEVISNVSESTRPTKLKFN